MKVTVLSGSGRYQDEWHDYTATSVEVARVLEAMDLEVAVRAFKPQGVVAEVPDADLVVVNAGAGEFHASSDGPAEAWVEAFQALRDYRARRGPVLALHAAAMTLDGLDEWPGWMGGRWVRGRSMHPPIGEASVLVSDPDHPITTGLAPFTVLDERYSHLDRSPAAHVLLHHELEGTEQPLVWVMEQDGGRTVYDALGHDARAFASPARTDLLQREVRWLLEPAAPNPAGA
jgi:type 1 glutamine amidotransferase